MKSFVFALLCCLAPPLMAQGLPDLGGPSQAALSPAMERHIGATEMRNIRLHDPTYSDDPEITDFVNRVGNRLVAQSSDAGQRFHFFVLKNSTINAFAMPGGYIGVHTGLIAAAHTESELAAVLAHEISHVTQNHLAREVALQNQTELPVLLSMAVAVLASRSNPDFATGAMMAGPAAGIQHQLHYSRNFEREADRMGLQLLERAGFDVRAMATFFKRLQKDTRLYGNNAPSYLQTHPLTTERIADMENRIASMPHHDVPQSLEFQMVRARVEAEQGEPADEVADFRAQLKHHGYANETAARYGLALALLRAGDIAAAQGEIGKLRRSHAASPMIETLAARLQMTRNDPLAALKIIRPAIALYPHDRALVYTQVDALLAAGKTQEALQATVDGIRNFPSDPRMHALQAKTYAKLGKRLLQHQAQAEFYALDGQVDAAIEQLQLAQKAGDGDYFQQAIVDARLHDLKARKRREAQEAKQQH